MSSGILYLFAWPFQMPFDALAGDPLLLGAQAAGIWLAYRRHDGDWLLSASRYLFYAALAAAVIEAGWEAVWVRSLADAGQPILVIIVYGLLALPPLLLCILVKRLPRGVLAGVSERLDDAATRLAAAWERRTAERAATPAEPASSEKPLRGGIPVTVMNADGTPKTIWVRPTVQLPLSQRLHTYFGIGRHVVMIGMALWIFLELPTWMRPVAEVGAAAWFLGGSHLLHHFLPF